MSVAIILCALSAAPAIRPYQERTLAETIEYAVARMGAPAVPHVVKLLNDQRADMRLLACRILARIGPDAKAAVPSLIELLDDPDPRVQKEAVRALGEIGPAASGAVPRLLGLLEEAAAVGKSKILRFQAEWPLSPCCSCCC